MITLRPYQEDLIDRARIAMQSHRRVLIQAPTGAGKTALTVHMMASAAKKGMRSFFIVHQNELLTQTSAALWRDKLEHGMIAAGKRRSPLPVQVASVQTLVNRLDQYDSPQLIIIDEAHRAAAETYRKVTDAYPDAYVIGLTATPARTDGQGLGEMFDTIVEGPTISWLIENGYLSDYEILAPPSLIDMSGVKTTAGDWNKGGAEAAVNKPTVTGDAVDHFLRLASGRLCVVMCITVQHAEDVAASYRAAGVAAEALHGGMSKGGRESALERFNSGETRVLASVQLLVEGVDIPQIGAIQWLRPTQSLIVWMQGLGRGLRPAPGKDHLLILDHCNNYQRHGLPDDEREWSLESKKRRSRSNSDETKITQCKKCYFVFRPGVVECPKCGEALPVQNRELETVDGELQKVEAAIERRERRIEQGRAKSLDELILLGIRKGMKNPHGWAANVAASREGRKAGPRDYTESKRAYIALQQPDRYGGSPL